MTRSQFKLLVVRLGAMGDILHALPAVTALRKLHPEWQIGWAVEPRWAPLLMASQNSAAAGQSFARSLDGTRPVVNRLHLVPAKEWARRPFAQQTRGELLALRRELVAARYDAVVDMQGAVRSALVARAAGCPRVIGEKNPRESLAKLFFSEWVTTAGVHVIEQDLEVASGIVYDDMEYMPAALPVDAQAEAWCEALFAERVRGTRGAVMINPGAGWGSKRWPVERYKQVARELALAGYSVLVNAGPGEEEIAELVALGTHGLPGVPQATAIAPSLDELIAAMRRVKLLIAGDTGPLHLACAMEQPVVGIYGPTDPARNGPFGTDSYQARFRVLRSPESKRDHSRLEETEAGLMTITVENVMAAIKELLAEGEGR